MDGTGPRGRGRMTGGGFGRCGGGRGRTNAGFGGRGFRHMYHATGRFGRERAAETAGEPDVPSDAPEDVRALRAEVEALKARLAELEGDATDSTEPAGQERR